MVCILVHGNNHFILPAPSPDEAAALAPVRHWSIVQIGEVRENLEWAVIVPGDRDTSPGVAQLLEELSARGVTSGDCLTAAGRTEQQQRPSHFPASSLQSNSWRRERRERTETRSSEPCSASRNDTAADEIKQHPSHLKRVEQVGAATETAS